ncbi:MAG: hypothetical protein IJS90_00810, partial [Clostridia bacterium]|nr:hypothetical protein [Clostridia bacterium]
FVAVGFCDRTPFSFECDRERLVGAAADGLFSSGGLWRSFENGTAFSYPGVAVKTSLSLPPGAKKEKILAFCPAATRSQASGKLALIRRSRLPDIRKAEKEAFGASELKWAECFIKTVFFGWRDNEALKAASENRVCESDLWQQGISGDIPVIRVNADGLTDSLLLSFMKLYKTLRFCCIEADLVFMTAFPEDYAKSFSSKIKRLAKSLGMEEEMYKKNGIKALSVDSCSKEFPSALKACRGITLPCGRESLEKPEEEIKAAMCAPLFEGENTFVPGGYFIGKRPSRPWCHTLSNPVFGTLLSDCSLGYTWAFNSRQNKLTPWNNDPCSSFTGEKLYLETNAGLFDCVNGASVYYYDDSALYGARAGELAVRTEIRVDKKAMKKRIRVEYSGNGSRAVFRFAVRPMLCGSERHARYIRSSAENGRLIFENPSNTEYGGFMCLYCGKGEAALKSFGGEISVAVSEEKGVIDFFMIFTAEKKALGPLAQLPFNENVPRRTALLTGDKETDEFASSLLLHQVYDTRLLARTGFYQCSGAYGFRDQLQDSMNICSVYPERAKTQLLRCASAQFSEGDVLHWFHVVSKPFVHFKGVRTLCSDDMLWLPLAAARYVEKTGDQNVLSSRISFIEAPVLQKNERERYGDYSSCGARFSLYEHCLRAIKKSLATGAHGLPFISGGDWNDSFSEVGIKGRGGSVWLGMFLSVVCREFAQVSELTGDRSCADNLREISRKMNEIVMKTSYNGDYFIRGFYDDGSVLGGRESGACKIDLLVQAFAVFAGIGTKEERVKALKTAFASLYNKKYGVLRLFYPPFGENTERAGYVNDYPEGVRENAGQYTHAAVWFLSALKKEGLTEEYDTLLHSILPNCRDPRFLNEPYALTADVGMAPGLEGRGGWSLYTGAAGWLWRTLFEE